MSAAFNPPVPEGDTVADHYCGRCRQQWSWCYCPTDDEEACGASRFADCVLPLGHPGFCEEAE